LSQSRFRVYVCPPEVTFIRPDQEMEDADLF